MNGFLGFLHDISRVLFANELAMKSFVHATWRYLGRWFGDYGYLGRHIQASGYVFFLIA